MRLRSHCGHTRAPSSPKQPRPSGDTAGDRLERVTHTHTPRSPETQLCTGTCHLRRGHPARRHPRPHCQQSWLLDPAPGSRAVPSAPRPPRAVAPSFTRSPGLGKVQPWPCTGVGEGGRNARNSIRPASRRPLRLINPHPGVCKSAGAYANQGAPPLVALRA